MKRPPAIVEVTWEDIFTRGGWTLHRAREDKSTECRTVGYLLSRDEKHIRLSGSWSDQDRGDTTSIPMGVVRSVVELKK